MFNSRKGVSEVVANVLIVLLVIVGIAVIWSVVKPTIDKGAAGIQSDCFTVQVEAVSCVPGSSGNADEWDVTVKRSPGSGSFESIELLFEDATGQTKLIPSGITTLTELSTTTALNVDATTIPNVVKVNTVLRAGGQLCQVTSQPVNCA